MLKRKNQILIGSEFEKSDSNASDVDSELPSSSKKKKIKEEDESSVPESNVKKPENTFSYSDSDRDAGGNNKKKEEVKPAKRMGKRTITKSSSGSGSESDKEESSEPEEGEVFDSEDSDSDSSEPSQEEFNDGYDESLMGDVEDQARLIQMTEDERVQEIFKRIVRRDVLKTRFEIEKKLRLARKEEMKRKRDQEKKKEEKMDDKERNMAVEVNKGKVDSKVHANNLLNRNIENKIVRGNNSRRVAVIQTTLDKLTETPLLGLEYLVEIIICDDDKTPWYHCILCDKKGHESNMLHHLKSFNHNTAYLVNHFPITHQNLLAVYPDQIKDMVSHLCYCIERCYGRLKPLIINRQDFFRYRAEIKRVIAKREHFSEPVHGIALPIRSVEGNNSLINLQFPGSDTPPDGIARNPVPVHLPEPAGVSIGCQPNNAGQSQSHTVVHSTPNEASNIHCVHGHLKPHNPVTYEEIISRNLADIRRKTEEELLTAEGSENGHTANLKKRECTSSISNQSHLSRSQCRSHSPLKNQDMSCSSDDQYKSRSPPKYDHILHSLSKPQDRSRSKSPTGGEYSQKSASHLMSPRKYCDNRISTSGTISPVMDHAKDRKEEVAVDSLSETNRWALNKEPGELKLKMYDQIHYENRLPYVIDSYGEKIRKKEGELRIKCGLADDERELRLRNLCDKERTAKNKEARVSSALSKDIGVIAYEYQKPHNHVENTQNYKVKCLANVETESFIDVHRDVSVSYVLQVLSAIECQLGSLGPQINALLAQAVILEQSAPKSSQKLLDNPENVVLFEMVREKLKGQIAVGIAQGPMLTATLKCIYELNCILETVKNIQIPTPVRQHCVSPVQIVSSSCDVIGDEAAIAQKIAAVVLKEGKTDVSLEELRLLINKVLGVPEVSVKQELEQSKNIPEEVDLTCVKMEVPDSPERAPGTPQSTLTEAQTETDREMCEMSFTAPSAKTENVDELSEYDLNNLIKHFRDLSPEEQFSLIEYLKKIGGRVENVQNSANSSEFRIVHKGLGIQCNNNNSNNNNKVLESSPDSSHINIENSSDDLSFRATYAAMSKKIKKREMAMEATRRLQSGNLPFSMKGGLSEEVLSQAKRMVMNFMNPSPSSPVSSSTISLQDSVNTSNI